MARPKKESQQTPLNHFFNVKPIHIARIKAYLDAGYDEVIIHGDGSMFTGKTGQLFDGKSHREGSDHHKEFNSGVEEINKNEMVSRSKFRAFYKKGEELPTTVDEVIADFYDNQAKELQSITKVNEVNNFSNATTIPDPEL